MKKIFTIALCLAFFQSQAQVRVKTEDGKTIELRSDGTWTVVGGSSTPTTTSPPKKSTTSSPTPTQDEPTTEPVQTQAKECETYNFGKITFTNNCTLPVNVRIYEVVKIIKNPNFGIAGTYNSQYSHLRTDPKEEWLSIRPNEKMSVYRVQTNAYKYWAAEDYTGIFGGGNYFSTDGNLEVESCGDVQIEFKR